MQCDVAIIGAGASGLFCAIEAGKRGLSVCVLEHKGHAGSKIIISGGGKCNFTNLSAGDASHYFSANPHFVKSALARYTPQDFLSLIKKHKISYYEKEDGQLFCSESSRCILDMLLSECRNVNVKFIFNANIHSVNKDEKTKRFVVQNDKGCLRSKSLVIATGGLSYNDLGASDLGLKIAKKFGISVVECTPALVAFMFNAKDRSMYSKLSGISFDACVSVEGISYKGSVLFTHRGLSGPAISQISTFWTKAQPLIIDILPDIDIRKEFTKKMKAQSEMQLKTMLSHFIPDKFAEVWCRNNASSRPIKSYSVEELEVIASKLHGWKIIPADTEGFSKAKATRGGVDTREISSQTMEAKNVAALFFIGEVLDVVGELGGYNLHWAWASGFAAGSSVL